MKIKGEQEPFAKTLRGCSKQNLGNRKITKGTMEGDDKCKNLWLRNWKITKGGVCKNFAKLFRAYLKEYIPIVIPIVC